MVKAGAPVRNASLAPIDRSKPMATGLLETGPP
jgi:hypothetical protein